MIAQRTSQTETSVPAALKLACLAAGSVGLLTILSASLAYLVEFPDFTLWNTFLSDIGNTPGWPQTLFNSGMLIAAPLRYLVLVLFALRMGQLGASQGFGRAVLVIGFIATAGTVAMTAVPFSVAPAVHKSGIGLYFLGVIAMQTIIFIRERSMTELPRILPLVSIGLVAIFLAFFAFFMLYETGVTGRALAVFTEWLCALTSLAWVFIHGFILGRE